MSLGKRVKETREKRDMKQATLCREANVSKGYLSEIESSDKNVSYKILAQIAIALEVPIAYLISGEIEKQRCENCCFFSGVMDNINAVGTRGFCRRYPPLPIRADQHGKASYDELIDGSPNPKYPYVGKDWWCGEWKEML